MYGRERILVMQTMLWRKRKRKMKRRRRIVFALVCGGQGSSDYIGELIKHAQASVRGCGHERD